MTKLSFTIITLNEEANIAGCIQSIQTFTDDIVVVDSQSTDRTREIAESLGVRVFNQQFLGDGGQKQFAADHCRYDWVFSIDADERLHDGDMLKDLSNQLDPKRQYAVSRANHIFGQRIRFGGSYPDHVIRIFNRKTSQYLGIEHSSLVGGQTKKTNIELLHYTHPDVATMYYKMIRSAERGAQDRKRLGKRRRSGIPSAVWTMLRMYFFQLGFLDGRAGFHWAFAAAMRSFLKHEIARGEHHSSDWRH